MTKESLAWSNIKTKLLFKIGITLNRIANKEIISKIILLVYQRKDRILIPKMKNKLSVVLATYNEEDNIKDCLNSVKGLADEVVVVDGSSTDKTVEIAKKLGAKVFIVPNQMMFHKNKQLALEKASGDWI
ncbi:unnamed protein product, partial [marine sediment metagenome]